MTAREFYDKRINEDPTIGSVQLMEEYASLSRWDREKTIHSLLNEMADTSNTIDLNAYCIGLENMFDKLNPPKP
jgi:hypothetical protein